MPFEPLNTDEKVDRPQTTEQEFEGQMMSGCMVIGLGSVFVFVLAAAPWAAVQEYRVSGLVQACLFGMVPSVILGAYMCRRFGLAGGSGFVGGSLISGIFMFLRLDQTLLRNWIADVPKPDYPDSFKYLVPVGWFLLSLIIAGLFIPSREFLTEAERERRR